jgi:hypothetical protein
VKSWYKYFLLVWVLAVLPFLVLASGFSNDWRSLFDFTGVWTDDEWSIVLTNWLMVLAPLLAIPFALRWR